MTADPLAALIGAGLVLLLAVLLFYPGRGLVPRWRRAYRRGERARSEDALKHIYTCEMRGDRVTVQSLAGALQITIDEAADELSVLNERGLVRMEGELLELTTDGRAAALHILRAHRLYEQYLADETGYPQVEWHDQAEQVEHQLSPEDVDALSARLGHPRFDPHGDPIPTSNGEIGGREGISLIAAEVDQPLRIVHLEDEPEVVFAQIAAEELHPGMYLRLIEKDPARIRFWAGGDEHVLAPIVAANIFVVPISVLGAPPVLGKPLTALPVGGRGRVLQISEACRKADRRRLMDLGLLPGTEIGVEMQSPGGDPRAYRVRGAVIALRKDQAELIRIETLGEAQ